MTKKIAIESSYTTCYILKNTWGMVHELMEGYHRRDEGCTSFTECQSTRARIEQLSSLSASLCSDEEKNKINFEEH